MKLLKNDLDAMYMTKIFQNIASAAEEDILVGRKHKRTEPISFH